MRPDRKPDKVQILQNKGRSTIRYLRPIAPVPVNENASLPVPVARVKKPPVETSSEILCSEMRLKLLSKDPETIEAAAWDIYCAAKEGKDISPLFGLLSYAIKPEYNTMTRFRIVDSIYTAAKSGHDIDDALPAVEKALESSETNIKKTAITTLEIYAKNGGELYMYIGRLSEMLRDTFPTNREAASDALKNYASQGFEQAHSVRMQLERSDDFVVEAVRLHCEAILESGLQKQA